MINLPGTSKQWQQSNSSDLFGNIFVTKNITFDTEGYLRLSFSPRAVMDDTIDADFDNPAVILRSEDFGYFTQTWDSPFRVSTDILTTYPTQITDANVPSGAIQADAVFFGGFMAVTESNDLHYYDPSGGTWTDTNVSLTNTSQSQHPMTTALNRSALAVANVRTVLIYATPLTATPTLLDTLTILADFHITGIWYFNQNIYVATQNRYGGHAQLYVWNVQGTAAQSAYEVDSNIIYSLCMYQDSIVLLTGNGALLRFNGSGFTKLDAFPIFYTERNLSDDTNLAMYKNIMKANGDKLYIAFSDSENAVTMVNQPNGLWCYDPNVGLYHRYSFSNSLVSIQTIATASVNTTTDQITVATAPVTGTEVFYRNGGGTTLTPLTNEEKYFTIKVDATHIKLALTKADALAGTSINLTGTGNDFQSLIFLPNVDFGQFLLNRPTAICVMDFPTQKTQYGVDVIWGSEVYVRANNNDRGTLGTVSTNAESRGYFVTPKIFSKDVTDTFNHISLKLSPFTSELDKIIIKYRTYDDRRDTIYMTTSSSWQATWTSTTTFTTTQTEFSEAEVGNEVEFLRGAASGLLAHITAISENAGTYTVTIDETFANYTAGDKSTFVFRNWIKWKTIEYGDSNANQYFLFDQLGVTGKFIQLKVELRGINVRVEELLVDNIYRLPFKSK